jgi:hypothetical protein
MEYPVLVIVGVAAIGALFVVLPVVLTTLFDHRDPRGVTCPATGGGAAISIDGPRAARAAVFGRVALSVTKCSLWPEREGCQCECLQPLRDSARTPGFQA